jgi:hypothetical protein
MKVVKKTFLHDCEHGWLSVKRKEIKDLGIGHKISSYSYMKGMSVYLEEDCDAEVYINAQKSRGVKVEIKHGKHTNRSHVRSYPRYNHTLL